MEIKYLHSLDIYDLEKSLMDKYGDDFYDLAWILFDDDRITDGAYLHFFYGKDEEVWEYDKDRAIKRNIVRDYLRELFPMFDHVLIHIYW